MSHPTSIEAKRRMRPKSKKIALRITGIAALCFIYWLGGWFSVAKVGIPAAITIYLLRRLLLTMQIDSRRGLSMLAIALLFSIGGTAAGIFDMLETVSWNAEQSTEVQNKIREDARFQSVTIKFRGPLNERSLTISGVVSSEKDARDLHERTSVYHFKTNVRWRVKVNAHNGLT